MTILITAPGEFVYEDEEPEVGVRYSLEDATTGTGAQNRFFHALLTEYYNSRLWSYEGSGYNSGATFNEFRNLIKRKLGAGFEAYIYVEIIDDRPVIKDAKEYTDIPEHIRKDKDMRNMIRGRLKSWADYTKKERRDTIEKLITEMIEVGVNSKHFNEIMEGAKAFLYNF